jgi:hypothetical protein
MQSFEFLSQRKVVLIVFEFNLLLFDDRSRQTQRISLEFCYLVIFIDGWRVVYKRLEDGCRPPALQAWHSWNAQNFRESMATPCHMPMVISNNGIIAKDWVRNNKWKQQQSLGWNELISCLKSVFSLKEFFLLWVHFWQNLYENLNEGLIHIPFCFKPHKACQLEEGWHSHRLTQSQAGQVTGWHSHRVS